LPSQGGERHDCFRVLLASHPGSELRKQLAREVAGFGWVADIFAAKI